MNPPLIPVLRRRAVDRLLIIPMARPFPAELRLPEAPIDASATPPRESPNLLPLFLRLHPDLANAGDLGGRGLRVVEGAAPSLVPGGEHRRGLAGSAPEAAVGAESPAEGGGEGEWLVVVGWA